MIQCAILETTLRLRIRLQRDDRFAFDRYLKLIGISDGLNRECPTEERVETECRIAVTLLFTGVTMFCATRVARFFKNGGTRGKKRRNSNKNGELRAPPRAWDTPGTGGIGWDRPQMSRGR